MRYCLDHWNVLRAGVDARGMSHLVAQGGEAAVEALQRNLNGESTAADWDPLMAAHWGIARRVLDRMGPNGIAAFGDPDWCPLCEIQQSYQWWDAPGRPPRPAEALDAQGWANSCLDSMLAYAREQKLIAAVQ